MGKRDNSIRLHPEHGLNPTMIVCSWCGQDTGEIALMGAAYKGEAPMRMTIGEQPCAKCKEHMAQGITFVERVDDSSNNAKRTGRWAVLEREGVERLLAAQPELLARVLRHGGCNVTPAVAEVLGLFDEGEKK